MLSSRPVHPDTDGHVYKSKTPGAALRGRNTLQENALYQNAMTGNVKGKKVDSFQPHTLQPQRLFKDQTYSKPTIISSHATARPLHDKTPFANRAGAPFVTPLSRGAKIAKLLIPESHLAVQTPLLRPSSTRKHIRVPRSASKSFETPQSQGNHWDVSDISIEGPEVAVVNESIEEEDYDEIEYMPPSAAEPPYQPAFDMPDYKNIGLVLATAMLPCHFEDAPVYDPEQDDILVETESYKLLLPELADDDPLHPVALRSDLALSGSQPALYAARTGIAEKSVTSTSSTAVPHTSRVLPVTRLVSRPPTIMKSTAPTSPRATKFSLSRKAASISVSRATSTAVTTTSAVARNSTASRQRYDGTSAAARNRSAATTSSVRNSVLERSGTSKPKANGSTLSSRRPAAMSSTCKPGVTSSTMKPRILGVSLRSTPAAGIRSAGQPKSPTDEEVLLFKFDGIDGSGVEDFKFFV